MPDRRCTTGLGSALVGILVGSSCSCSPAGHPQVFEQTRTQDGLAGSGGEDQSPGLSAVGDSTVNGGKDTPVLNVAPADDAAVPVDAGSPKRPQKCDDAGHCSCMNIASIGQFGAWGVGAADDTVAFRNWLNTKSSAAVDTLTSRVTLSSDLLSKYDVILLQSLTDGVKGAGPFWKFTADEMSALADWVNAGGGLVSLQGYGTNGGEITPTNQLLGFSGISYKSQDILTSCPQTYSNLCGCWGDTTPIWHWNSSDPISSSLSAHIKEVGGHYGRPIVPGDAVVCATDDSRTPNSVLAAKTFGKGRVAAFADEWITYTSQWLGSSPTTAGGRTGGTTNANCSDTATGVVRTANNEFQVAQFWYNLISWASEASSCAFVLDEPAVVPR